MPSARTPLRESALRYSTTVIHHGAGLNDRAAGVKPMMETENGRADRQWQGHRCRILLGRALRLAHGSKAYQGGRGDCQPPVLRGGRGRGERRGACGVPEGRPGCTSTYLSPSNHFALSARLSGNSPVDEGLVCHGGEPDEVLSDH
jgi:hypothetical protein